MKVNIFKPAALVSMMMLAACTNEVIDSPDGNSLTLGQGEDVIRISLSDVVSTRTARPIGSSESLNNVNRIGFIFLKENGNGEWKDDGDVTMAGVIEGATDAENVTIDGKYNVKSDARILELPNGINDDTDLNIKFEGLTEGIYEIIAYGYNFDDDTDVNDEFPYDYTIVSTDEGLHYMQCEVEAGGENEPHNVQEIFAGRNDGFRIGVNQHGRFERVPDIILTRQVAGLMAYFYNAPVTVDNKLVAKITVSAKADVPGFSWPASTDGLNADYNGYSIDESWVKTNWVNYLTFDMTSFAEYTNYKEGDPSDGATYDIEGTHFANENQDFNDNEGFTFKDGTLFGSRFILAYPSYRSFFDCATLNICYWGAGDTFIKSVPLKWSNGNSSDEYQYTIKCNNFYSIGTKSSDDYEEGQTDDNPVDLDEATGYEHAELTIESDWVVNGLVK